jgi:hypothetical protein
LKCPNTLSQTQIPDDIELLLDRKDFEQAATTLSGSRDVGAQLFCALLRSMELDVRLVCSLQVLPFQGITKTLTPKKPPPVVIPYIETREGMSSESENTESFLRKLTDSNPRDHSDSSVSSMPGRVRRFGQSSSVKTSQTVVSSPSMYDLLMLVAVSNSNSTKEEAYPRISISCFLGRGI